MVLSNLGEGGPAWAVGLDQLTFQSPFQAQPLCDPVTLLSLH